MTLLQGCCPPLYVLHQTLGHEWRCPLCPRQNGTVLPALLMPEWDSAVLKKAVTALPPLALLFPPGAGRPHLGWLGDGAWADWCPPAVGRWLVQVALIVAAHERVHARVQGLRREGDRREQPP